MAGSALAESSTEPALYRTRSSPPLLSAFTHPSPGSYTFASGISGAAASWLLSSAQLLLNLQEQLPHPPCSPLQLCQSREFLFLTVSSKVTKSSDLCNLHSTGSFLKILATSHSTLFIWSLFQPHPQGAVQLSTAPTARGQRSMGGAHLHIFRGVPHLMGFWGPSHHCSRTNDLIKKSSG
jgi:hypothetical protein